MKQYVQKYSGFFRRVKPLYKLYNLSSLKYLRSNKQLYQEFGVKKGITESIDSRDFEHLPEPFRPWLDDNAQESEIRSAKGFDTFPKDIQLSILGWPDKGYLVWKEFLDEETVESVNKEVERLLSMGKVGFNYTGTKIMDAHLHSTIIDGVFHHPQLLALLGFILGRKVVPFQTINFLKGSQQKAHADVMHMTTFPRGFLIAAWIALEDIQPDAGPLFYYPGSHRWPYVGNRELGVAKSDWLLEENVNARYENYLEGIIKEKKAQPEIFTPRKGDVLIWHANLLHGGMPVLNPELTRKSMVAHYFADGVICFHEISQRPAVIRR